MWWDENDQAIIFEALNVFSMSKFDFFAYFIRLTFASQMLIYECQSGSQRIL